MEEVGAPRCGVRTAQGAVPTQALARRPLGFLLLISICFSALAQYAIDWHTIDGGGGTSTGGVYSVTGGFWALPQAVQSEGAPTLMIAKDAPGFANISWTPPSTNWVLQESLSLSPANWTNAVSGVTNPIVVPTTLPAKFYRLSKP